MLVGMGVMLCRLIRSGKRDEECVYMRVWAEFMWLIRLGIVQTSGGQMPGVHGAQVGASRQGKLPM